MRASDATAPCTAFVAVTQLGKAFPRVNTPTLAGTKPRL
jgi:hypothetical protein